MILSVSRRTDIPAFYFDWFLNRLKEGYLYVKNPMNPRQVSRITLNNEVIDCIVFWTKDPANALAKLDQLENYMYYFQYTLNPYGDHIEKYVPPLKKRFKTFIDLSEKIGKDRVIWRYDPIFLTDTININYHVEKFQQLSKMLGNYTNTVMISVLDCYKKIKNNMEALNYRDISEEELSQLIPRLKQIAEAHGLNIRSCAEDLDLESFGIKPGSCIDYQLASMLLGQEVEIKKDKNQRNVCGCAESIEVGVYNTCLHGCRYCYANFSPAVVAENHKKHDINAPLLIGNIEYNDKVTERKVKTYRNTCRQSTLFK